ncbi:MAG: hypothetical protein LBT64_02440 [Puniceicoccales bacterium]|nr:hypothetical protein [Puniceicoccales bacterium]
MVEKTVEINTRRVALGNQIAKKKLQMNEAIGIKPQCLDDDDEREALRNELNREKYEKMKNDPTVLQLKKEIAQLEEEAQALDIEAQQHKACLNLIDYLLDGIDNSKDQRKLIGIYLDEEPAFMKLVGGNVKKEYDNLQKLVANGASPDAIREAKEKLTNLYNKMAVEFANELRENHGFSLVPA